MAKNVKVLIPRVMGPARGVDASRNHSAAGWTCCRMASSPGVYGRISSCKRRTGLKTTNPTKWTPLLFGRNLKFTGYGLRGGSAPLGTLACSRLYWVQSDRIGWGTPSPPGSGDDTAPHLPHGCVGRAYWLPAAHDAALHGAGLPRRLPRSHFTFVFRN